MDKNRKLITSLYVASFVDAATTYYALNYLEGFREKGVLGESMVASGQFSEATILRIAVPLILITGFALTQTYKDKLPWLEKPVKLPYTLEKATKLATVICWTMNASNVAQIAYDLASR